MKKPKMTSNAIARRRAFLDRHAERNTALFERDIAANTAPIGQISGSITRRCNPTVGIAPPPPKSKFVSDERGRWHFNPNL